MTPTPSSASYGDASEPPKVARLAVFPSTAAVEVDGQPAPVGSGFVEVSGAAGSMHLVRVTFGKRDGTYPVLLTESGPVPQKVELAEAPSTAPALPASRRPRTPAPQNAPAPTAPPGSAARTME